MKFYKVTWLDISGQNNKQIKEPYNQFLTESYSIGEVLKDKDTILVIYAGNEDGDKCFDAIPIGCVKKIELIK